MASQALKQASTLLLLIGLYLPHNSLAAWELSSEFKLQLSNSLFTSMIQDFWSSLQGGQTIPVDDIHLSSPIPIAITGIQAKLQYNFPLPQQVSNQREWQLASNNVAADLYVQSVNASQTIVREINGILVSININAECHNIHLTLPKNITSVAASVRADVAQGQVHISLPSFDVNWPANAWQIASIDCTGADGFDEIVKTQTLQALSTIHNFDAQIHEELSKQLNLWSQKSSLVLMSAREIPTNRDDMQLFFEPRTANDIANNDLEISGVLRFVYPYISQGNDISNSFALTDKDLEAINKIPNANSRLIIPFETIRGLMMGNYLSGKLTYSLQSYNIPSFQALMQSRWAQFFVWPDLFHFEKNTTFLFQFLPMGPPSFANPHNGNKGEIVGDLFLPLNVRMFAPQDNTYIPYVQFFTNIAGVTRMKLVEGGKVQVSVDTQALDINYQWSKKYLDNYDTYENISVALIADAIQGNLQQSQGIDIAIPVLSIGLQSKLSPTDWNITGNTAAVEFVTLPK